MTAIPQVVTVVLGGATTRYLSTQGFISSPTDTPANTVFLPRIRDTIEYSRKAEWWMSGTRTRAGTSLGTIDVDNTDGELDSWLAEDWRNREVTIRRGLATVGYDDHEHVAFAVVDRVSAPEWHTIRIALRDKGALLDVAAQQTLYPALVQAPSLEGTPKPICIGSNEGVPLTLQNAAQLDFDVSDSVPFDITEVTDQGVIMSEGTIGSPATDGEWEICPNVPACHGVRFLVSPTGKVVAKVQGAYAGSALIERLPDVIAYLLGRSESPVSPSEVDSYVIDNLDTHAPYTICYWGRDGTTIASILSQIMDSFGGWWYFDRLGQLRVGRLEVPGGDAVVELDDINLLGDIKIRLDEARGLTDAIGAQRNWSPHAPGEIAGYVNAFEQDRAQRIAGVQQVRVGGTVLHPTYAHAVGAPAMKTLHSSVTNAQTEADRITTLYSVERYFYEVTAAIEGSLAYTLEPGDAVLLTSDRFGLSEGKLLTVVEVNTRLMSSAVALTLWGEGPQPGDF